MVNSIVLYIFWGKNTYANAHTHIQTLTNERITPLCTSIVYNINSNKKTVSTIILYNEWYNCEQRSIEKVRGF